MTFRHRLETIGIDWIYSRTSVGKMPVVKLDRRSRILLTKDLRQALGLQTGDKLVAKPVNGNKIILEKSAGSSGQGKEDALDWLLRHPAQIKSEKLQRLLKKEGLKQVLESWKDQLWSGE